MVMTQYLRVIAHVFRGAYLNLFKLIPLTFKPVRIELDLLKLTEKLQNNRGIIQYGV